MKNRYSFKKLNWLLVHSFEAEKTYYNAGEDIQQVALKRFFNHQSVNRNRFSYQISEQLVQLGLEPVKEWVQKGHLQRDWKQERKVLVKQRPHKLLKRCRAKDEENLKLYDEILSEKDFSGEVIRMLKKQRKEILASLHELGKFQVALKHQSEPKKQTIVRTLSAI